ncbi:hypothetical protein PSAB6_460045 [Paraburkholderia sabiae]|nr:hypothetical protein PSAB6_460045 [Paraburkholderia sabiae]
MDGGGLPASHFQLGVKVGCVDSSGQWSLARPLFSRVAMLCALPHSPICDVLSFLSCSTTIQQPDLSRKLPIRTINMGDQAYS